MINKQKTISILFALVITISVANLYIKTPEYKGDVPPFLITKVDLQAQTIGDQGGALDTKEHEDSNKACVGTLSDLFKGTGYYYSFSDMSIGEIYENRTAKEGNELFIVYYGENGFNIWPSKGPFTGVTEVDENFLIPKLKSFIIFSRQSSSICNVYNEQTPVADFSPICSLIEDCEGWVLIPLLENYEEIQSEFLVPYKDRISDFWLKVDSKGEPADFQAIEKDANGVIGEFAPSEKGFYMAWVKIISQGGERKFSLSNGESVTFEIDNADTWHKGCENIDWAKDMQNSEHGLELLNSLKQIYLEECVVIDLPIGIQFVFSPYTNLEDEKYAELWETGQMSDLETMDDYREAITQLNDPTKIKFDYSISEEPAEGFDGPPFDIRFDPVDKEFTEKPYFVMLNILDRDLLFEEIKSHGLCTNITQEEIDENISIINFDYPNCTENECLEREVCLRRYFLQGQYQPYFVDDSVLFTWENAEMSYKHDLIVNIYKCIVNGAAILNESEEDGITVNRSCIGAHPIEE